MVTSGQLSKLLKSESLHLLSPLEDASNETYLATVGNIEVVYKPVAGEAPLWDFAQHTLSKREVMAHWVSNCLGWDLVPVTVWTERGPLGPGSVQLYVPNAVIDDVSIFDLNEVPQDWIAILAGQVDGKDVLVAHRDNEDLLKLAAFDAIINNGDRKAGHILRDSTSRLFAIDHGVSFHVSNKLRTILWGWAEEELSQDLAHQVQIGCERIQETKHEWLLSEPEYEQLLVRIHRLLREGLPLPSQQWPAVPWPIF